MAPAKRVISDSSTSSPAWALIPTAVPRDRHRSKKARPAMSRSPVALSSSPPMSDQASWPSLDAAYPTRHSQLPPLSVLQSPPSSPPRDETAQRPTELAHREQHLDQLTPPLSPETLNQLDREGARWGALDTEMADR
ncbi:MAG: hypothetical protein M1826_003940 [Phylliscum demangeonii]|nr:MAG: hypothetical protein M1826_003940 [Phylliscum demangeonii]